MGPPEINQIISFLLSGTNSDCGGLAVGEVVVSVEVRNVAREGVISASYVVTQGVLGHLASRGGGEGDGVIRVTGAFHRWGQGQVEEVQPYLADVGEEGDGDGAGGDRGGGGWVLIIVDVGDELCGLLATPC